jgi:hypothetical protein
MKVSTLRAGDYVLVTGKGGNNTPAEVIFVKGSTIGVRLANGGEVRTYDSRKGYGDIKAAARLVQGKWIPL